MKTLLLTFDVEEFVGNELGLRIEKKKCFDLSRRGLIRVLDMLKRHEIKATFFSTSEFASTFPALIRRVLHEEHELGLHALQHADRYNQMSDAEALQRLRTAKQSLEKKFGKVISFRAPQMSRPSLSVLQKIGIKIDSSYHPTWVPGHYNLFFKTRKIHRQSGVYVIPVSVTPLLRLPFSWIWLRNLPLSYARICTLLSGTPITLYFHPWEFEDVSEYPVFKPIVSKTGANFLKKLECYLVWTKEKGYQSLTFREFYFGRKKLF